MNNTSDTISTEARTALKRLCPYAGAHVPEFVKQIAREYPLSGQWGEWLIDDDDSLRTELDLCDMDRDPDWIEPAGYVALRVLSPEGCELVFELDHCPAAALKVPALRFPTMQEAKDALDNLLFTSTAEIPPDDPLAPHHHI